MSLQGRSLFRALRWVGLGAAIPALWACTSRSLEAPNVEPQQTDSRRFPQRINRDVDLLFLVDDSNSMRLSQENLLRNFPRFMQRLESFEGGLPNVHIAVISSDMGTGNVTVDRCGSSKGGIFQSRPRGDCTATNLQTDAHYISNVQGVANYTGSLADVFTCIAALGEEGCGFEQQFAAITRALGADGAPPPAENQGFLRDDAYLAIIMITNEDDCSTAVGDGFYQYDTLMSQLGPAQNFRCNEFGHICDGGRPTRYPPNNAITDTVSYQSCVSAEGSGGLKTVAETAAQIRALKRDPASQILMAAITGPSAPYQVHWKQPSPTSPELWPEISHSCVAPDQSYADPSIRVSELVRQFGGNGLLLSICDAEFDRALENIAQNIEILIKPPCIEGQVATRPGTTVPDCTVVSHTRTNGRDIDSAVPACADNGGAAPCWNLVAGQAACTGRTVQITSDPTAPTATSQDATVACALCVAGVSAPERGCP
jgi:hypothetical protein